MDRSPVRGVARLAAILDSLPEALLLIDGGGRVVNANAVAVGWFEAPGAPLVGRSVTDLLSGFGTALARVTGADPAAGVWTEPGDAGAASASAPQPEEAGVPTRMVAKLADGSAFPAEVVRSFLPAVHGGLEVVVVRDVSRVADAEAELRRQQKQTELILRAASEGIVGVDTAGRVVLVNPAAARILKYRASELGGLEFDALLSGVGPGEPSPVADTLRTGRKHRLGSEAGLHLTAKGGGTVPVELSTAPVLEGETLVGAVVTFVDLARFRFPALTPPSPAAVGGAGGVGALGGIGAIGAAADGGISPESVGALRRPLDAARSELARLATSGEALTSSARHQLAHVTAELAEAVRLVEDLLDVAAGPAGLRKRPAELGRIVHAATDAATDLAGAAGIDLAVHTGPAEVVIDAERMTQAVRHLLVDTVQASPRGSTVVVAAARRGPIARIEVRGAEIGGIPEHLGFARTVVERHGGQLTVHRVDGKGVTYVIELPVGPEGESELATGTNAASRNLVEETRIIPVVRELDPPEPAGTSAHGGRRRLEPTRPALPAAPAASAVATTTTIPRQAGPTGETAWFDGVRGYAAQTAPAADATQTPAAAPAPATPDQAPAIEPRGRRRAAQHQPGDNYLIQHVEATAYEPDAPLRTSGSYQEEAALATSGNFTPEAQQASALFGTDDGMPLFRDEVPTTGTGTQAASGRHGPENGQQSAPFANGFGGAFAAEPQNSPFGTQAPPFMTDQQATSPFGGEQQPPAPFMAEAQQASPFGVEQQSPYGAEVQPPAPFMGDAQQPSLFGGGSPFGADAQVQQSSPSPFGSGQPPTSPFGAEPQAQVQQSSPFGADAQVQQPSPFGSGQQPASPFGAESQSPFGAESQSPFGTGQHPTSPFGADPQAQVQQPSPFGTEQRPTPPFGADAQPQQPPAPFGVAQQPAAPEPHAWPNPAQPDPQPQQPAPALAAWPPPDAAEPAAPPTLLVWPAPEPGAEQLLVANGYAPTALKAPAQLQETGPLRPVALLADPVGVPVTRAALHTLRAAAADSGIPLFVTAGLGAVPAASVAATARRGADPSALLRALTPEQVASPRVLLLEENPDLAAAFAISLERDGMRVVQAATENDAMSALSAEHPQLVVMNLTLVRRRRSGVIEWLRAYERLHLAPTVLYTVPAGMANDIDLVHALRTGAAAVHLTDREAGPESANRLLDLMGKVSD